MANRQRLQYYIVAFIAVLIIATIGISLSYCTISDNEIPKPNAYYRIAPYDTTYVSFDKLPILLMVNSQAKVDIVTDSTTKKGNQWVNIGYPLFNATVYCSYANITPGTFKANMENRYQRILQNSRMEMPKSVVFEDTVNNNTSQVFFSNAESITALQFITTDSVSYMFTGALYFSEKVKEDSIAPVVDFITGDIMYMLQNIKKR